MAPQSAQLATLPFDVGPCVLSPMHKSRGEGRVQPCQRMNSQQGPPVVELESADRQNELQDAKPAICKGRRSAGTRRADAGVCRVFCGTREDDWDGCFDSFSGPGAHSQTHEASLHRRRAVCQVLRKSTTQRTRLELQVLCETEPTADRAGDTQEPASLVHLTSQWAFQLINTSLPFSRAQSVCRGHFSSLPTSDQEEEQDGLHLKFSALNFPKESRDGFARINFTFPSLSSISVCVRVQWDLQWSEVSTIFSYAAAVFTNEFQLRSQVDSQGRILLALIIHGKHMPYKASFSNDGAWHHICVTWTQASEQWVIYVDGERKDAGSGAETSRDIHGDGIFILGQDQDSFGGNFTEPFFGNITDLNVWNTSLEARHVRALYGCASGSHEVFFSWSLEYLIRHEVVREMEALLFCPGKDQQMELQGCRTLQGWSNQQPVFSLIDCSEPLPFICRSNKERFLKLKMISDVRDSQPTALFSHILTHSNKTQVSAPSSLMEASVQLDSCVQALEQTEEEGLQPVDMVSLIQLLSQAADVPPETELAPANQSEGRVQKLSRDFISVADSVISQDNAHKWQAIKEVVNGPMDVVKSIDRLVTSLSSHLIAENPHVTIQSPNIKVEVQQQKLDQGWTGPNFCGPDSDPNAALDCISVPQHNIQDLHNNGFQTLTLVNTWYGSLRPLFPPEENISIVPTVTDGSQRYLGTVLGSSVISTTVLGDEQPVSTAVYFHLHHRTQDPSGAVYDPVCAFWDFDLAPESGGWWNTKGCEVVSKHYSYTVCFCNHTTNFALLLQVYEVQWSPENQRALEVLTFIGCGVSLCGLLFTLVLFIAVGVPKSDRTTVHKNLIVALAVAQLLLMCSDKASANEVVCFLVTALLHLFYMASFSWMLVEGLLLWSKVVSVNINEDRRMKVYYVIGWGLPVLIVGVTLAVSVDEYKAEEHCWLNVKNDTIWAFVGPVVFVLAVNSVVLCRVVMVTVSSARRRTKMLSPSSATKMQTFDLTWAVTRPVLILLPVLGLTWLCGVLVHLSVVVAYVFIALNAFQVRNAIKRIKEKRKALSFTNCSQPSSFLPSQRAPVTSWGRYPPIPSSPETSETSGPPSSASTSLVIKNGTCTLT
ncbi:hypothetical protein NQD34_007208 [Periophthalmus magnuspinnatus]|nr:hypothetical protein NQD34_007208 [Periophthalmus magnuspinnatus]